MHAALGLAVGGTVMGGLGRPAVSEETGASSGHVDTDPPPGPLPVAARLALASALGGLVALASADGAALDGTAERALVRRGAKHPRLWIGAAATVLSAAVALSEDRVDRSADAPARPTA